MEHREAFIKLWSENLEGEEMPDLHFFDASEEGLYERARVCSENLKEALGVIQREGLLFRYLCEILQVSDLEDFKDELNVALHAVFGNKPQEIARGAKGLQKYDVVVNDNDSAVNNESTHFIENPIYKQDSDEEEGSIRDRGDSFAFQIESSKSRKVLPKDPLFGSASESGIVANGSELGFGATNANDQAHLACKNSNTTAKTSAVGDDVELFNKQNIKRESGPCEASNSIEKSHMHEGLADGIVNESKSNEEASEANVDSCSQMDENNGSQPTEFSINNLEPVEDLKNAIEIAHSTDCTSFKEKTSEINEENIDDQSADVDRSHLAHSPPTGDAQLQGDHETKSSERHKASDGNNEMASNELQHANDNYKGATSANDNIEQTENNNSIVSMATHAVEIEGQGIESKCDSDLEGKPSLAEEETCFDLTDEKEPLNTPDLYLQGTGVVDDLISYLESIQLENSSGDDDDSLADSTSGSIPFGHKNRPHGLPRKQQLQSSLSASSIMSSDSCLSPWALDLAMAEIHSADSSDENDKSSNSKKIHDKPEIKLPASMKGLHGGSPPPVRPPRRRSKKGMLRAHTVGTPKQLRPSMRTYSDDDEVFRKEEEGYEGDQESIINNSKLSHSTTQVRFCASSDALEDERRKLRRSRGSNVILDEDNIDFPSSPLSSPTSSPKRSSNESLNEDDAKMLHARKWVASAMLDSEKGYLCYLNMLYKYMRPVKASLGTSAPILSVADFNKIFYKIEDLHTIHNKFYNDLEIRVANWNVRQIIGDLFLSLVDQFDTYREYILNYRTVIETIRKCRSNEQFNQIFSKEIKLNEVQEVTTLEGLFSKPVDRIGRYCTVLTDLLKQTPQDHPDYGILSDVQVYTQQFLIRVTGGDQKDGVQHFPRVKRDHVLLKDGFLVELADGARKFRHLFLFNDILICTKRKISGRHEQYVSKWYIQLADLQLTPNADSEAAQIVPVASKADFDLLKGRIVSLKAEIKREQGQTGNTSPDVSPASKRKRAQSTTKVAEKLKKKLAQQEAALLLAIPSLPLHLYHRQGKTYTLLCKSDTERADWKETIQPLLRQDNLPSGQVSLFELQTLLEASKKLRTCKTIGKVSIKEDKELFNGVLYVHVQNGKGFHRSGDLYCLLEVDHYGQFVKKAKTKISRSAADPVWDQDFDLEVEGTKELRIHVYSKSRYTLQRDDECGLGKIELQRENLADLKKRTITIALDKQGAITLSLQYSKTLQGIQRKKSVNSVGVFGVDITAVTERESSDIPLIVIGCVREIEKRGLDDVGIYRLSGATSDVRRLRDAFDENSQSALVLVSEADIHAVCGLLKMYLRDLPEPLFTDDLYCKFVKAYGTSDAEDKKELMVELFTCLPTPNKLTAIYLFQHLRRVADKSDVHKMGLNNLATVFGPNVLRPSLKTSNPMDLAQGTLDVMSQVGIFMYFLKLDSDVIRLPNDPELMRRLDPSLGSDVIAEEDTADRLI